MQKTYLKITSLLALITIMKITKTITSFLDYCIS